MRGPTLLDGNDYDVMLRNLWRLLAWGYTLGEARSLLLDHAGVSVFPQAPSSRSSRRVAGATRACGATVH